MYDENIEVDGSLMNLPLLNTDHNSFLSQESTWFLMSVFVICESYSRNASRLINQISPFLSRVFEKSMQMVMCSLFFHLSGAPEFIVCYFFHFFWWESCCLIISFLCSVFQIRVCPFTFHLCVLYCLHLFYFGYCIVCPCSTLCTVLSAPILLWVLYCLPLFYFGYCIVCPYSALGTVLSAPILLWVLYCLPLFYFGYCIVCPYSTLTTVLSAPILLWVLYCLPLLYLCTTSDIPIQYLQTFRPCCLLFLSSLYLFDLLFSYYIFSSIYVKYSIHTDGGR